MDSGNSSDNSSHHQSSSDGNDGSYDSRAAAADSLFIPNKLPLSNYNIHLPHHNSINPNALLSLTPPQNMTTANNFRPPPPPPSSGPDHTAARNPKKRSRVSRRAPTTVLTTDTTNFRAMVQEFTGIPSTPFGMNNNMSSRLDLFRSTALNPSRATSAYLRRQLPQKLQPSTVTADATVKDSNGANISSIFSTDANYQLPISSQALDLYNVATNPLLSSLLQTANAKFTLPTSTDDFHHHVMVRTNGFDHEFGLGRGEIFTSDQTLHGLPSLLSTDQITSVGHNNSADPDHGGDNGEADYLIRPMKMAKNDHCDSTRSEGMIESWIRSSE